MLLDNLDISISECEVSFFDDIKREWCVDCWWVEDCEDNNRAYCIDEYNGRGGVVATISEDGNIVSWKDGFQFAIKSDGINSWVLDEISNAQRRIKSEFGKA